jgi:hypothetical protein
VAVVEQVVTAELPVLTVDQVVEVEVLQELPEERVIHRL